MAIYRLLKGRHIFPFHTHLKSMQATQCARSQVYFLLQQGVTTHEDELRHTPIPRVYMTTSTSLSPHHTSPRHPIPYEPPKLYNPHAKASLPHNHTPYSRQACMPQPPPELLPCTIRTRPVQRQYDPSTTTSQDRYNTRTTPAHH